MTAFTGRNDANKQSSAMPVAVYSMSSLPTLKSTTSVIATPMSPTRGSSVSIGAVLTALPGRSMSEPTAGPTIHRSIQQ